MSSVLALAVLGTPILLLFMLLPTLLELRKPQDAGPRRIMYSFSQVLPTPTMEINSLQDIEGHNELDITLKPFINVIFSVLPSLGD